MRLTMGERRAVIRQAAAGYRKAGKKRKGQWLDELVALTGYHRWYAVRLLRTHGRTIRRAGRVRLVADVGLKARRGRQPVYDAPVLKALRLIWAIMDFLCGKRLKAILPEVIVALECHREIQLSAPVRRKLLAISAATIDRLLAPSRRQFELRGRSGTRPAPEAPDPDSHVHRVGQCPSRIPRDRPRRPRRRGCLGGLLPDSRCDRCGERLD